MKILTDFDLTPYNCFAVSCTAHAFCEVNTPQELLEALDHANEKGLPVLVLGGGSNVLFTSDYPGLVLRVGLTGITTEEQADSSVLLQLGAGENWHQFVIRSIENGLYGIENMALIPGTVGAAPIQNIGAYGAELADVFVQLDALEVNSGELWTFDREACQFGYRDSVFKHGRPGELIITSVTLALSRDPSPNTRYQPLQEELAARGVADSPTPQQIAEAVIAIRRRKLPDPAVLPNCGSFFKNPVLSKGTYQALCARYDSVPAFPVAGETEQVKVPAAWLLDRAGWKGKRRGPAGVHDQQAVVIVNHCGASGSQLLELAREMQKSVLDNFGVSLEPEVRII